MQLKMPRSYARPLGLASLGLLASFIGSGIGCSANDKPSGFDNNPAGAGGTTATGGTGGTGSGTGGSSGSIVDPGAGGASGSSGDAGVIDPDASCANDLQTAGLKEVNMLVMFDRSGSMTSNQVSPTQNRWQAASAALNLFFQDTGSAGLRVALRFFPHNLPATGCSNGSSECNAQACSQPLVPIAALTADPAPTDAQEAALVAAVGSSVPGGGNGGGTPTYAALSGAEIWAVAYQAAHPTEATVVVFVSDGEPNGCDENTNNIAALATAARMQGVLTYAVGMQDGANVLNAIAQAGGTNQAIMVEAGMAQSALLTALQSIRGQTLNCNFAMPIAKDPSQPIDPNKININYTPAGATQPTLIGGVADAAACTTLGGWYYDNPAAPTSIILCPETCTVVKADTAPKIEIVLGCTVLPPPPPT